MTQLPVVAACFTNRSERRKTVSESSGERDVTVVPLQDLHNLDTSARFNRPGEPDGNWRWRATGELLPEHLVRELRQLTELANRRPSPHDPFLSYHKAAT